MPEKNLEKRIGLLDRTKTAVKKYGGIYFTGAVLALGAAAVSTETSAKEVFSDHYFSNRCSVSCPSWEREMKDKAQVISSGCSITCSSDERAVCTCSGAEADCDCKPRWRYQEQ